MFLLQIKECADNVELSGGRKGAGGGGGTVEKKCAAKAVVPAESVSKSSVPSKSQTSANKVCWEQCMYRKVKLVEGEILLPYCISALLLINRMVGIFTSL